MDTIIYNTVYTHAYSIYENDSPWVDSCHGSVPKNGLETSKVTKTSDRGLRKNKGI